MGTFNTVIILHCLMFLLGIAAQSNDSACEAGADVINREHKDFGTEFGAVMSTNTWDCDGPIVEWQYYTYFARYIQLIAFTRVDNISTNWKIVGYNNISADSGGHGSYKVPEDERFWVNAGNAIGYSGSDIKWSNGGFLTYLNSFSNMGDHLEVGEVYEMRWPHAENRTYSIKGIIEKPQISFDIASNTVVEGMILNVTLSNVGKYNHTIMVATVDGDALAGIDYQQQNTSFTLSEKETAIFQLQTIGKDICGSETKSLTLLIYWDAMQIDWTDNHQMSVTITSAIPCGLTGAAKAGITIASLFGAFILSAGVLLAVVVARKYYTEKHRFKRLDEEDEQKKEREKGGTKEQSGLLNDKGSINT